MQGSGVGPVLFLIYIDDIAKLLQHCGITVRLFADDVNVYLEFFWTHGVHMGLILMPFRGKS